MNAQYTYDALVRLTSLTSNGETYTYQYDAFNRRTKKITPQGEERYLYIDQNEIDMVNSRNFAFSEAAKEPRSALPWL